VRLDEIEAIVDRIYRRVMVPIEKAKQVGTLNATDRSRQYTALTDAELLRSLNEAWTKIRCLEKSNLTKDADIAKLKKKLSRYRIVNIALTSILTTLAWEGLQALVHFFR